MDERLARELVKSRKAVKQKYQSLKNAEFEAQSKLEETYKPITQPLQELISSIGKSEPFHLKEEQQTPIKKIHEASTPRKQLFYATSSPQKIRKSGRTPILPTEVPSFWNTSIASVSQIPSPQQTSVIAETTPSSDSQESTVGNISDILEQTRQTIQTFVGTNAYQEYLSGFHELPRSYIDEGVKDVEHKFDHHYGIVHDVETDKLFLGLTLKPVEIIGKNIKVEGLTYPGTPGLYELLFKKEPVGYKKEDLDNYMDILTRTNAYRRNNDPNEQVQGNGSHKYVSIIGPYLQRRGITKTKNINPAAHRLVEAFKRPQAPFRASRATSSTKGTGLTLKVNKHNTDYVYWDNVNELVDRLRLLVASMMAGHTGHNNEIISIIEELKEANIII